MLSHSSPLYLDTRLADKLPFVDDSTAVSPAISDTSLFSNSYGYHHHRGGAGLHYKGCWLYNAAVQQVRTKNSLPRVDKNQVWSLTQLHSVDFSQSRIGVKKCVFNKRKIKVCVSC